MKTHEISLGILTHEVDTPRACVKTYVRIILAALVGAILALLCAAVPVQT